MTALKLLLGDNESITINGVTITGKEFNAVFVKENTPKKKEKPHPQFNELKELYLKQRPDWYWRAMDSVAINTIIKAISNAVRKKQNREAEPKEIIQAFEYVLGNLPQWYQDNDWSPATISANFINIVDQIKKNKKQESTSVLPAPKYV